MTQITDSDREAAADIWRDYVARVGEIIVEKQMRQGGLDYGLPTRLAEHRIQSTAAMSTEIERLKGERDLAYGLLWGMSIDRNRISDDLAWRARKVLLTNMTQEDQANGIEAARTFLGQQKGEE